MNKSKIVPGAAIGLVLGGAVGYFFGSGEFNLLTGGITGGIVGFLVGWFISRDASGSQGDSDTETEG